MKKNLKLFLAILGTIVPIAVLMYETIVSAEWSVKVLYSIAAIIVAIVARYLLPIKKEVSINGRKKYFIKEDDDTISSIILNYFTSSLIVLIFLLIGFVIKENEERCSVEIWTIYLSIGITIYFMASKTVFSNKSLIGKIIATIGALLPLSLALILLYVILPDPSIWIIYIALGIPALFVVLLLLVILKKAIHKIF